MAGEVRIHAMPIDDKELYGHKQEEARKAAKDYVAANPNSGWKLIEGYKSLTNLWEGIKTICDANDSRLKELIIQAHGSPDNIDGIFDPPFGNCKEFGDLMKKHKDILCERVHVYCSGCNTGIDKPTFDPIAKSLADKVPFGQAGFNVKLVTGWAVITKLQDQLTT